MISLVKFCNANKKRKFINILIYALLVIETLAFVILPFIKSEKVIWKIILFTIWGIASLELIYELVYYLVNITYLQKRDKPIKDKGEHVLFWITFSAYIIALISIFLGVFLVQNFGTKNSLGNYVFIVATILIVLGIAFLIVSHRKNLLEFFKIISIIALSVIAVVFLLSGIIAKEINEVGSKVLICIGAGALIFICSSIFIKVFLKLSESKNLVKDVGLIVLVFVLLAILSSIFIIYVVPQDNQDVFVTIISAVLGGVVTFLGVAWTIKKQDKDRKEDEIKKVCPIVNYYNEMLTKNDIVRYIGVKDTNFIHSTDKRYSYEIANIILKNTEFAPFFLKGFYYNNHMSVVEPYFYIDRDNYLEIKHMQSVVLPDEIQTIGIIIQDVLQNEYFIGIDYVLRMQGETIVIEGKGCYFPKLIKKTNRE